MLIYAIDDEKIPLLDLCETIQKVLPDENVEAFTDAEQALQKISDGERPDIVFSDIRMPGMDGLELAVRIKRLSPDTKILFVTGYSDFALAAFKVHINGYIMKPATEEQIREEIEFLQLPLTKDDQMLLVQCFGSFEVFYNGEPLMFKRRQTKELFAYLIDCNGAFCTAEEIAAVLWEDESDMKKMKHRLRNLVSDLRATLKEAGQEDILLRSSGRMAIKRDAVDCDYFRMLNGDMTAVNTFHGEYMKQYPWAELTKGKLHFME